MINFSNQILYNILNELAGYKHNRNEMLDEMLNNRLNLDLTNYKNDINSIYNSINIKDISEIKKVVNML